ncbi:MAG: trypsin-like peptidase domain-containing protein [Planctomycetota bacterium]
MVRLSLFVRISILATLAPLGASLAAAQQVVLLDFSMPGCAPCRQMDPVVSRLQQEGFPVRKVDGTRQPQVAQQFRVDRYPTFVLVADGQEVWRSVGLQSYDGLRQLLVTATQQTAMAASNQTPPVVPATFAGPPPQAGGGFQVGSDLGPAPAVTIPGVNDTARARTPAAAVTNSSQPTRPATDGPNPDQLLSASVRLKVKEGSGNSFGTGTIIDARAGEALVLTCGHLFRSDAAQATGPPTISVELFQPVGGGAVRVAERVTGQLISFDLENDVALVSIRPAGAAQVAHVAASPTAAMVGQPTWSVGCDRGADPTVRSGRVTSTDKYQRPPSLTTTGAPVVGRSGGGLFNARGEVVGVCFGADEPGNEGFYAKLTSIHAELDKLGLTEIYRGGPAAAAPAAVAATTPAPVKPPAEEPATIATTGGMVPVHPRGSSPLVRGQDSFAPTQPASLTATERAALQELSRRAADSEVVCVIRPKEPGGKSEVITLDSVSPQFLQALQSMGGGPTRQ